MSPTSSPTAWVASWGFALASAMRRLIDRRHQGHGYGRAALRHIVEIVRDARAHELLTSYSTGKGEPWPFYERLGFVPTGELDPDGEIIRCDRSR